MLFLHRDLFRACSLRDLTEGIVNEERRIENEMEEEEAEEESCRMRPEKKKSASSSTAIHPSYQQRQKRSEERVNTAP